MDCKVMTIGKQNTENAVFLDVKILLNYQFVIALLFYCINLLYKTIKLTRIVTLFTLYTTNNPSL